MPLTASSIISSADDPCVSVLREKALVRGDDRRISTSALLSDMPETRAESRTRPIIGPGGVNQSQRKPLMVLRL
jgi:hypothetical protein